MCTCLFRQEDLVSNYFLFCAAVAASIATFNRSCAFPYAVKSPFARAARESASACRASASAFAKSVAPLVGAHDPVDPPLSDVPEFPAKT